MKTEGPPLEQLTRRLTDTPPEFLEEPRIGNNGRVNVVAVVNDLLRMMGAAQLTAPQTALLQPADPKADHNRLAITLITAWLLADPDLRRSQNAAAIDLLTSGAKELAAFVPSTKFVTDPDRREELARFSLAQLGLRPAGESEAQAQDRLTTISASERARVVKAAQAAEERARQIREALAKKRAEEGADKWSRE